MAFVYSHQLASTSSSKAVPTSRSYPRYLVKGIWWRLWWHAKAYSVIAAVLLVAVASLLFLQLHGLQRQIIQMVSAVFDHDTDPAL